MPSGLVRIVLPTAPLLAAFALTPLADSATITGRVTSNQGLALQGANVYITELNVSVGTNEEGVYRIVLASERMRGQEVQLRVRAIGFQPQAKRIRLTGDSITVDFSLTMDVNRLSEMVVTGVTGSTETRRLGMTVGKAPAGAPQPPPNPPAAAPARCSSRGS